jgi:hypothetical protein
MTRLTSCQKFACLLEGLRTTNHWFCKFVSPLIRNEGGGSSRTRCMADTLSAMFLHRLARELDRHKPPTMAEANLQWETGEVETRVLILGHVGERIWGRTVGFDSLPRVRRRIIQQSRLFIISSQTTPSGFSDVSGSSTSTSI